VRRLALAGVLVALLAPVAPAAAVGVDGIDIPGAETTNGVAVTADGAAWVATQRYTGNTQAQSTLARVSPTARSPRPPRSAVSRSAWP
jgi:hypothetical protein